MTWLMGFIKPTLLLTILGLCGFGLAIFAMVSVNMAGVWAVVAISACLSLMFPTIYGVALQGLGEDTKFGAAGLVMAILGGALMPMLQGAVIDSVSTAFSYIVPAGCLLIVAAYGFFDLQRPRQ